MSWCGNVVLNRRVRRRLRHMAKAQRRNLPVSIVSGQDEPTLKRDLMGGESEVIVGRAWLASRLAEIMA